MEAVRGTVRAAHELGVRWLTLYAFSTENWSRPKAEVDALMRLLEQFFEAELPRRSRTNVRIRAIGRRDRLPLGVRGSLENAIARTATFTGMTARVRALLRRPHRDRRRRAPARARRRARPDVDPDALDEKTVRRSTSTIPSCPDLDLLIRTGGEASRLEFPALADRLRRDLHVAT